jgi:hypothetical protein
MKIPSDRKILEVIFKRYKSTFADYENDSTSRASKVYVPVNCAQIAEELKTEPDIVFGRLYYHLERKHGYVQADGTKVPFFTLKVGNDAKCVNFPLLVSVLADLQQEGKRFAISTAVSFLSLGVSVASMLVALAALTAPSQSSQSTVVGQSSAAAQITP